MPASAVPPLNLTHDLPWVYRFLRVFLLITAFAAAWLFTWAFFDRKIHTRTGSAAWIWAGNELISREPIAFAAVRDFVPPEDRSYARLSVAAHPEYSVHLNGRIIGNGAAGRNARLDRYEIGPLLVEGTNRLVVLARSRDGVGGILASIDYAPDRRNEEATPKGWKIVSDLSTLEGSGSGWAEPRVLGRPPVGPWNIPRPRDRSVITEPTAPVAASRVESRVLSIPEIAVLSGVAVVRVKAQRARVFEFEESVGRIRFVREDATSAAAVAWRSALSEEEIATTAIPESAVFAAGELRYDTPGSRAFRYVIVFDPTVDARLLPE